jgi:hypothetical protein
MIGMTGIGPGKARSTHRSQQMIGLRVLLFGGLHRIAITRRVLFFRVPMSATSHSGIRMELI